MMREMYIMYENDNLNNEENNTNVTNESPEMKKKKLLMIIGALVVVIIVMIIFAVSLLGTKNKPTTEESDTVVVVNVNDVDKVLDLTSSGSFKSSNQYASKLYIVDNKLYALLTASTSLTYNNKSIIVDNNKLYFIKDGIKDVNEIVDSSTGSVNAYIYDLKNKIYKLNLVIGSGEPFEITEVK